MKSFSFDSSLSKKEVYLTMKELTDSKSERPLFVGDVEKDGFSVMKYQPFSNNVLNPQINATVTENGNGTNISLKASLNKWDRIALPLFGLAVCIFVIYWVINAIVSVSLEPMFPAASLLAFGILIFLVWWLIFTLKTKRTLKILNHQLT